MRRSLVAATSAWFSEGLGFSCTKCGKCCKLPDMHIWVSLAMGMISGKVSVDSTFMLLMCWDWEWEKCL